jgi:hypothetical protein
MYRSVKESPIPAICSNTALPENRRIEIEEIKVKHMDHPKVLREKLDPKNHINPEKTTLPKGLLSKKPKSPENSTRVIMEQFGKREKYAPYPPRKASKSPVHAERKFRPTQKKQIDHKYAKTG